MAYCMAQYRNVYINNGKARPCCWYERKELKNKVHQLTDIVDVFHSQEFNAIRENTDPKPSGCWKCQMHEEKGGKSHRQLWNEREIDNGEVTLTDLDFYMGNLCNLACVTRELFVREIRYAHQYWFTSTSRLLGLGLHQ